MKKQLLAFSIACLFFSCETKYFSVLVTNGSSKTVTYTYNGLSDERLASGASKTYEVEAYTLPPANIRDEIDVASIEMKRDGDIFTFVDAEPIIFNVANSLPFDITIKADNYIWDKKDNSFALSIPAQEEIKDGLFIYTEKPKFTTTSDYPVKFEWKIIEEKDESGKPKKKLSLIIK